MSTLSSLRTLGFWSLLVAVGLVGGCSAPSDNGDSSADATDGTSSDAPTPIIVDTDANNELDDQHAIAYALLSGDAFRVEGVTVNRTANGGDISAQAEEARRVVRLTGLEDRVPVVEGASGTYDEIAPNVDRESFDGSEAVDFIIEQAHATEGRLVVVPIGKLTNVALALEKDPSIASELRVVWLGSNFPDPGEYNLENDPSAVNPVIQSEVPFEIAVVRYDRSSGTAAVQTFLPEVRAVMSGLGPRVSEPVTGRHGEEHRTFGDYSVSLFEHVGQHARSLYDVAAVAVVKNPDWGVRKNAGPHLLEDGEWVEREGGDDVVVWELFHTSKIIDDFFSTLRDPVPAGPEWTLQWHDEFDGTGLPDSAKWGYEHGFIRNDERQFYTRHRPENARQENGHLVITARKESYRDTAEYTSASLITRDRAEWTYGRIEVRADLPSGRGMWPAIWMLGTNIDEVGWPACGEIDIMEYVGFEPETIHANVHTAAFNHVDGTAKGSSIEVEAPDEGFHTYAVEWTADRIDFFVDGRNYFTFENSGEGVEEWPFDRPHYLILNAAVGGAWGGQEGIDDSIFPQEYRIDYVRVYEQVR